jgi:dihydroorotate dehydrogenase
VGGVFSGADAKEKIEAGASLVEIFSSLIYRGPGIVKKNFTGIEIKNFLLHNAKNFLGKVV